MFIKELHLYLAYLKTKSEELKASASVKHEQYLATFADNLKEGIGYYQELFSELDDWFADSRNIILRELESSKQALHMLTHKKEHPAFPITYVLNREVFKITRVALY